MPQKSYSQHTLRNVEIGVSFPLSPQTQTQIISNKRFIRLLLFKTAQKQHCAKYNLSTAMDKNFLNYRPAHLAGTKKNYYVAYSVVNPETDKLTVRRIKLNYIKDKKQRKLYGEELVKQINYKLACGYNPFIEECSDKLIMLSAATTDFLRSKRREPETHNISNATFDDYKQQLRYFQDFIKIDLFLYKVKRSDVNAFLDWLYIDRKVSACTRNHYLQTLRTFFTWCVSREYIKENPAALIKNAKQGDKIRAAIPAPTLQKIFNYLHTHNRHYLFACYLVYGCFIRPSEICRLRVRDISFKNQTIFISKEISKNKKNQVVTMPRNVAEMILDLNIYKYPSDYYLVGKHFLPSEFSINSRQLRKYWLQIRKELNLPATYQFYSLKDSGITQMLDKLNIAEVRDQARHSSISITDVYTDRAHTQGNERIKNLEFTPSE